MSIVCCLLICKYGDSRLFAFKCKWKSFVISQWLAVHIYKSYKKVNQNDYVNIAKCWVMMSHFKWYLWHHKMLVLWLVNSNECVIFDLEHVLMPVVSNDTCDITRCLCSDWSIQMSV